MPKVINIIVVGGAVGFKFDGNVTWEQLEELASRIVQLETDMSDERATAATAVGGHGVTTSRNRMGSRRPSPGRPISFIGEDCTWRDWSGVFRSPLRGDGQHVGDNATSSR